jgi:hypothetical protein
MAVEKKVLSRDDETWLTCCWADCERPGYSSNRTYFHDHNPGFPCTAPEAKHVWYVFCTERHRQFFLHSHKAMGKLPPGYAKAVV